MNVITKSSRCDASYLVRRRRLGKEIWLIKHNDAYLIDGLADLIWQQARRRQNFETVVLRILASSELDLAGSVAQVAGTWKFLIAEGLATVDPSAQQ